MEDRILKLEQELRSIKERNIKVEGDKAWEISFTRKLGVMVAIYVVAAVWLVIINEANPWIKAIFPPLGYFLSTLSLTNIKVWWLKKYYGKEL